MQKYISEARLLLALAIPVILAQIAQTAMGFVDTVMAGGYSATDMAAVLAYRYFYLASGDPLWSPTAAGINAGYRAIKWFRST